MAKQKRIEKQTPIEAYKFGLIEASISYNKIEPHYLYLLDKADDSVRNQIYYPVDYPNPAAALAYSFGAYVKTVLKIVTLILNNEQLEKQILNWFSNVWLPQAELDFLMGRITHQKYVVNCYLTNESMSLIMLFNAMLSIVRKTIEQNSATINSKTSSLLV